MTAEQANVEEQEKQQALVEKDVQRWRARARERVDQDRQQRPGGQVQLSSATYLDPDRFDA